MRFHRWIIKKSVFNTSCSLWFKMWTDLQWSATHCHLWYHSGTILLLGASQMLTNSFCWFHLEHLISSKVVAFLRDQQCSTIKWILRQECSAGHLSAHWQHFVMRFYFWWSCCLTKFSEQIALEHSLFLGNSVLLNQLWRTSWETQICLKGQGRQFLVWNQCVLDKFLLRSRG